MWKRVVPAILMAVAATAGCGNSSNASSDDPVAPPAEAPAKKSLPGVEVYANDKSIVRLTPDQVAGWVQLPSVLPMNFRRQGMWSQISIKGRSDTPQILAKPSDTYPDKIPALYPGDNDSLSFGMFDSVELAKHGQPVMHVDNVREVHVAVDLNSGRGQNDDGNSGVGDPRAIELQIGKQTIKGDKLIEIPRDPAPNGGKDQGWRLTTLLAAAHITKFEKLMLTDSAGTNLELSKSDVSDSSVPFVKLNKQAKLRVRVWKKQGDGWTPAADLRDLKSIDVVK
jgi:hypothetical protein|nr:hypothetical protein [Kofleriaceae bacterium]